MNVDLRLGDCRQRMAEMPDNSVDSIVCDPPYELGFMGKAWDASGIAYDLEIWRQALRVLKPGGHLLAFSGSRTYHRMTCAIEDAGFEIRDQIMWVYGSGFPKSLDVSKAIDKAAGAAREVVGSYKGASNIGKGSTNSYITTASGTATDVQVTAPATDDARCWSGWGTALKPSFEPLCVAQKPFTDATELDIINANLIVLGARLWSMSLVSHADKTSSSSHQEFDVACGIARWSAADAINTRADLSEVMGTSQFESSLNTSLNIVTSWRNTLADLLSHGSTSITKTKLDTTTDLKTLSFCLSQITPRTIIMGQSQGLGSNVFAEPAEAYFDAELRRLSATLALSVVAPAMSLARINSLAVDEKISHEPICVARKPLEGTVAANVLKHGTGAINVDGCRIATDDPTHRTFKASEYEGPSGYRTVRTQDTTTGGSPLGRWPANFIHDGSDEVTAPLGEAARFFYCAKASRTDREEGCDDLPPRTGAEAVEREEGSAGTQSPRAGAGRTASTINNHHPTVKPTDLMRYLARLVTPPGGTVLDPFMGSGSTGKAAALEGFNFIGIEMNEDYLAIARARINAAIPPILRGTP